MKDYFTASHLLTLLIGMFIGYTCSTPLSAILAIAGLALFVYGASKNK